MINNKLYGFWVANSFPRITIREYSLWTPLTSWNKWIWCLAFGGQLHSYQRPPKYHLVWERFFGNSWLVILVASSPPMGIASNLFPGKTIANFPLSWSLNPLNVLCLSRLPLSCRRLFDVDHFLLLVDIWFHSVELIWPSMLHLSVSREAWGSTSTFIFFKA